MRLPARRRALREGGLQLVAFGLAGGAIFRCEAQPVEEPRQLFGAAVNVADDDGARHPQRKDDSLRDI